MIPLPSPYYSSRKPIRACGWGNIANRLTAERSRCARPREQFTVYYYLSESLDDASGANAGVRRGFIRKPLRQRGATPLRLRLRNSSISTRCGKFPSGAGGRFSATPTRWLTPSSAAGSFPAFFASIRARPSPRRPTPRSGRPIGRCRVSPPEPDRSKLARRAAGWSRRICSAATGRMPTRVSAAPNPANRENATSSGCPATSCSTWDSPNHSRCRGARITGCNSLRGV